MAEREETKKKKRNPTKKWKKYEISENKIKRKDKFCPKCGVGVFLARHKDRVSCGKCGYTEFIKK